METNQARAVAKYISMSSQKVRLVIDVVRGMDVNEALSQLRLMPQRAAEPVSKVIASAAANAEENLGLSRDDLYVAIITADEAPTRRWRRFGARGRFKPLERRSSHISVLLRERE
ncbi:MAG: 50S ribosomal protein L22 [Ardenticatenales bacterium]|nr:50S ribosomal protein L22 [Ardenticatenales bacterium]